MPTHDTTLASSSHDTAYRRVIIVNKTKDQVILDTTVIGPYEQEMHLREIFANTPELKGVKGKDMHITCATLASWQSECYELSSEKVKKKHKKKKK